MKSKLGLILCIAFMSLGAFATDERECLKKYETSKNPQVVAAGEFLHQALDDCDYPSMDVMVKAIREAKEMAPWNRGHYEDPLNCSVYHVITKTIDTYCKGKPWTIQKVQAQLLINSLPEYFSKNPRDAELSGWVD